MKIRFLHFPRYLCCMRKKMLSLLQHFLSLPDIGYTMKKIVPYIFVLFVCSPALRAQDLNLLDKDNGFMKFKLDSARAAQPYLKSIGKQYKLERFRPYYDDSLFFQGIQLEKVILFFHKGECHSIDIKAYGTNGDRLYAYFKRRYGDGEAANPQESNVAWYAKNVNMFYEKNFVSGMCKFSFYSKRVHQKYRSYLYDIKYGKPKGVYFDRE